MLSKNLKTVTIEENRKYLDDFRSLVESTPLTEEKALELCREKDIAGNVIFERNYHPLLAFELLGKLVDSGDYASFSVNHLSGSYGLGIGSKLASLEIIKERHSSASEELPLKVGCLFYWVEVPGDFRKTTYDLLPPNKMKRRFKNFI